jgi:DNA-binding transcriptional LysR family regulator
MQRNNVTLSQLRAFAAVADKRSFVGAAELLHRSQPALSQCIKQLEEEVGSPLFKRTTRSVHLTVLGISFLPHVRHLLAQFDKAIDDARDVASRRRGRVVIACLPSVAYRLMPRVIAMNERTYPGIRITVRDINRSAVIAAVTSGEADLGIGSSVEDTPELVSTRLARDRFHAVYSKNSPLAEKDVIRWRDLAEFPFVGMTRETGIRDLVDVATEQQGIHLRVVAEVSNVATLYGLLEEGIGVSALPGLVLPRDENALLRHRLLSDPSVERTILAFWRRSVGLSPSAKAVLQSISRCLQEDAALNRYADVAWELELAAQSA